MYIELFIVHLNFFFIYLFNCLFFTVVYENIQISKLLKQIYCTT